VERTRDVLVGSFDLFTSLSAQTTNELVKALTFVTVVIGVFAAVAGLLGMNFDLPLFKSGTAGFIWVVGALLALSGASLWIAKRRSWI
jgi:magnesium transporter